MESILTILGSAVLSLLAIGMVFGRYKQKIETLETNNTLLWKRLNTLSKDNESIAKELVAVASSVVHLEKAVEHLTTTNAKEFQIIAKLITDLGEKLSDNYVRKDDMSLWLKK